MANVLNSKLAKFVEGVYRRALADSLEWSYTDEGYVAPLDKFQIRVGYEDSVTTPEGVDAVFELLSSDGRVRNRISDVELFSVEPFLPDESGWFSLMSEVIDRAEVRAMGLDSALNEALEILESN